MQLGGQENLMAVWYSYHGIGLLKIGTVYGRILAWWRRSDADEDLPLHTQSAWIMWVFGRKVVMVIANTTTTDATETIYANGEGVDAQIISQKWVLSAYGALRMFCPMLCLPD